MTESYLLFGGDESKCNFFFFNNLLSITNLMQTILTLLILKEQEQGDTATEGNNAGTKYVIDYIDQFITYEVIILSIFFFFFLV